MPQIYAVANQKGGVAKTSTACNLAYGLSQKLMRNGAPTGSVLLVDIDPQGNVADFFGLRQQVYDPNRNPDGPCISKLLTGNATLKQSILSADRPEDGVHRPNLFIIPASLELEYAAEELLINDFVGARRGNRKAVSLNDIFNHYLAEAKRVFDFIIIDCPPKLDTLKVPIYRFAESIIVPVKTDHISVVGAVQHTQDIAELRRAGEITAQVAYIVPTMHDGRQVLARQMLASLQNTYGAQRVIAPIPNSVKVKESPAAGGLSVFEYAANSDPARAYQNLVEVIYGEQ